jgi:hypothetical protein
VPLDRVPYAALKAADQAKGPILVVRSQAAIADDVGEPDGEEAPGLRRPRSVDVRGPGRGAKMGSGVELAAVPGMMLSLSEEGKLAARKR